MGLGPPPPWVGRLTVAGLWAQIRQADGKAGAIRWKGIRPTVRGVAMNPVDHPHGGGEGRTGEGKPQVSPWNTLTKGYRTRNNKRTQNMIVSRRKK